MIEMRGRVFGDLTVIERAAPEPRFCKLIAWTCRCRCGRVVKLVGKRLRNGECKSCGCLARAINAKQHTTHAMSKSVEYRTWQSAKTRCYNPRYHNFQHYGGRGIAMADEWRDDFPRFLADMGPRPKHASLDRIDNNGPYAPGNCRWALPIEQHRNTRVNRRLTWHGETLTLTEWALGLGIPKTTLSARLTMGWTVERALSEPLHQR